MAQKSNYRFNLKELEDKIIVAYEAYLIEDSPRLRTDMYTGLKDLAFAVLSVGPVWGKYKIDFEEISYEYAVYMFERIITGNFRPVYQDRFPWQQYVRFSLLHVINESKVKDTSTWETSIHDMGFFIENEDEFIEFDSKSPAPHLDEELPKFITAQRIHEALKIHYTQEEINRLYPICIEILHEWRGKSLPKSGLPSDIRDFLIVVVALSKRITQHSTLPRSISELTTQSLEKAILSSVRSTVFLSAITNTDLIKKELLLALDTDSLYRLVHLIGGQTITMPTLKELDLLMGTSVAAARMILRGDKLETATEQAKKEFNLTFVNHIKTTDFIYKILSTFQTCKSEIDTNEQAAPVISLLSTSIESLECVAEQLMLKSSTLDSRTLVTFFKQLSTSAYSLTRSLSKINAIATTMDAQEESIPDQYIDIVVPTPQPRIPIATTV